MTPKNAYSTLSSRALIHIGGPDWRDFLQGLITQDVENLNPGTLRFAALLTPQGRLIYDLFLFGLDDGALLDVAAVHRQDLIRRLSMYRLRAKVQFATDERPVCAQWNTSKPGPGWITDPRIPQLGWRGVGLSAPQDTHIVDEAAYDEHRLAQGVPGPADWGVEATYPIEANFDFLCGIDFKKGCFVGQETTSRMKRRGQIKTRMLPLQFDGPAPPVGTEVLNGTLRAGQVLSGGSGIAMATLRLDRIAGALTAEQRPVRVFYPDWFPREIAAD